MRKARRRNSVTGRKVREKLGGKGKARVPGSLAVTFARRVFSRCHHTGRGITPQGLAQTREAGSDSTRAVGL